jgi:aspartate/methionine/tyrosine aminotransferase
MLDVHFDPQTEITITTGATEAIYSVLNAVVNPGDRVVVLEPAFDCYAQAIANAGGAVVPVKLHAPDTPKGLAAGGWALDWEEFDAAVAGGFRLLVLNSPHNPTGKVFSHSELDRLAAGVLKADALVMTDEVYEGLVFGEVEFHSLSQWPALREKVIRVSSAAKTFGFTGFKVGWVCASPALSRAVRLVHQSTVFCTPPFLQTALGEVLEDERELEIYLKSLKRDYEEKKERLRATLERAGFQVAPTQGAYFLMANYEALAGDVSDVVFAKQLIETHSVAAIPPSVFYFRAPKSLPWLRFTFCKTEETLQKASELLLRN